LQAAKNTPSSDARRHAFALPRDLNLSLNEHEELVPDFTLLAQHLAGRDVEVLAHPRKRYELLARKVLEERGALQCLDLRVLLEQPYAPTLFAPRG
jgi:hypothetical protein